MIKFGRDTSCYWYSDEGKNLFYLRNVERCLNENLKTRGYLYANQVYEALGIDWDPSKENYKWIYNPEYEPYNFEFETFPKSNGDILIQLLHHEEES